MTLVIKRVECEARLKKKEIKMTQKLYVEPLHERSKLPTKATRDSACYDVYADLDDREITIYKVGKKTEHANGYLELYPGDLTIIPTGNKMCTDRGWKIELVPRSGNAIKKGITLIKCVGIIDADYRDEVGILLTNTGLDIVTLKDGERLAQLSIEPVHYFDMVVGKLPETDSDRNGGMGHTGEM